MASLALWGDSVSLSENFLRQILCLRRITSHPQRQSSLTLSLLTGDRSIASILRKNSEIRQTQIVAGPSSYNPGG